MRQITLPEIGSVAAWRDHARALLAAGIPPSDVLWNGDAASDDLFATETDPLPNSATALTLPKSAVRTLNNALCHMDPERFARAYGILWDIKNRCYRWGDRSRPQMRKLLLQAKEVGRDIHKMHAFVRFREMPGDTDRRQFAAWFEPDHNIVEAATPFFAKRFGDMDWVIATPTITARFVEGHLAFETTVAENVPTTDATEELWRTYYRSIFNPARLMTKAMCAEMPKKYWKNLPEADLIPELVRTAQTRARAMQDAMPTMPVPRTSAVKAAAQLHAPEIMAEPEGDIRRMAEACTRCSIGACATQLVWGEGPTDADIMIVGEQPGDQEDLTGRPFVGPAGQLFDKASKAAGLDRKALYVTNAVKHFKYTPRGKRRIHSRPNAGEVEACKWWLDYEIRRVRPKLTVALGATAAKSLTGNGTAITQRRGHFETGLVADSVLITVHPASILRAYEEDREKSMEAFVGDLRKCAAQLG